MMSEPPITKEALMGELKTLLADIRQQSVARFDPTMLAMLALVPVWTEQLALRCEFARRDTLSTFLEEAQAAGFCLQKRSANPRLSAWYSALVYTNLAPFLPEEKQKDALTAVLAIEDEYHRGKLLAKLAVYVKNLLPDVLTAVRAIKNPAGRATALVDIAFNLGRG
jgi:hypothetical protein